MKKILITLFLVLSSLRVVYAQDVVVGEDYSTDVVTINEELRKLDIDEQLKKLDALDLRLKKIENLATPTADTDATTKAYVDDYIASYVASHSSTSVVVGGPMVISSTGNVSFTAFGFQPSAVLFIWAPTSAGQAGSSGYGFMTATFQCSVHTYSANANWAGGKSSTAIAASGGGDPFSFDYVSFDSDGFTINVSDAATSTSVYYLAIK